MSTTVVVWLALDGAAMTTTAAITRISVARTRAGSFVLFVL